MMIFFGASDLTKVAISEVQRFGTHSSPKIGPPSSFPVSYANMVGSSAWGTLARFHLSWTDNARVVRTGSTGVGSARLTYRR